MYLCAWLDSKLNRIKIDDIGPDGKVKDLKKTATQLFDRKGRGRLEFTYRGCTLNDDDKSLADYEIGEDAEIHVFELEPPLNVDNTPTDEAIHKVSWEIQVVSRVHNFHSIANRTMKNRAIALIRENVPDAENEAVAYLLNPELLLSLRDEETLKKIATKYPSILPAAKVVSELLQTQTLQYQPPDNQNSSSSYYYAGAHSSGEEEDMDSNTESSRDSHSPSRNSSVNAITPAQLAAAIANATNSVAGNSATTPSAVPNIITNEMLNNALQQAINISPMVTPPVTPGSAENLNFSSLAGRYETQLGQMHELGLTNDAINIRALHTSSGNLQEAVELVLNGVID